MKKIKEGKFVITAEYGDRAYVCYSTVSLQGYKIQDAFFPGKTFDEVIEKARSWCLRQKT